MSSENSEPNSDFKADPQDDQIQTEKQESPSKEHIGNILDENEGRQSESESNESEVIIEKNDKAIETIIIEVPCQDQLNPEEQKDNQVDDLHPKELTISSNDSPPAFTNGEEAEEGEEQKESEKEIKNIESNEENNKQIVELTPSPLHSQVEAFSENQTRQDSNNPANDHFNELTDNQLSERIHNEFLQEKLFQFVSNQESNYEQPSENIIIQPVSESGLAILEEPAGIVQEETAFVLVQEEQQNAQAVNQQPVFVLPPGVEFIMMNPPGQFYQPEQPVRRFMKAPFNRGPSYAAQAQANELRYQHAIAVRARKLERYMKKKQEQRELRIPKVMPPINPIQQEDLDSFLEKYNLTVKNDGKPGEGAGAVAIRKANQKQQQQQQKKKEVTSLKHPSQQEKQKGNNIKPKVITRHEKYRKPVFPTNFSCSLVFQFLTPRDLLNLKRSHRQFFFPLFQYAASNQKNINSSSNTRMDTQIASWIERIDQKRYIKEKRETFLKNHRLNLTHFEFLRYFDSINVSVLTYHEINLLKLFCEIIKSKVSLINSVSILSYCASISVKDKLAFFVEQTFSTPKDNLQEQHQSVLSLVEFFRQNQDVIVPELNGNEIFKLSNKLISAIRAQLMSEKQYSSAILKAIYAWIELQRFYNVEMESEQESEEKGNSPLSELQKAQGEKNYKNHFHDIVMFLLLKQEEVQQ